MQKIQASGSTALHTLVPIQRYGHCNFTSAELMAGFAILLRKVAGQAPVDAESWLRTPEDRARYRELVELHRY